MICLIMFCSYLFAHIIRHVLIWLISSSLFYLTHMYDHRLLVFVVILALSNLGTSFASAILAKDTTTNDNNELVNKKTGEAVATDQAIVRYESEELTNESSRRLVRYGVSSGSFTSSQQRMLLICGRNVRGGTRLSSWHIYGQMGNLPRGQFVVTTGLVPFHRTLHADPKRHANFVFKEQVR